MKATGEDFPFLQDNFEIRYVVDWSYVLKMILLFDFRDF